MWKADPFTVSGVFTGYRVIRRGARGALDFDRSFIGDCYQPGSFAQAKADAEARCADLNAAYAAPNVTPLFGAST
ncbi:hypothetical protein HLH33_10115 [Gluconacetobacter diazotrophicus]|uniref:Uncharacterized protein n=1 Tax=Gluconacetobacter diazotrophicus TaxID=33996 RepID=A0A7W4FF80_GLUDI|nr:hypothetical protein [Gluconacetobacter diazotrophicus]MBB2156660.1 hypothetical protein [Gluconacetobacter diazotrophicus]